MRLPPGVRPRALDSGLTPDGTSNRRAASRASRRAVPEASASSPRTISQRLRPAVSVLADPLGLQPATPNSSRRRRLGWLSVTWVSR